MRSKINSFFFVTLFALMVTSALEAQTLWEQGFPPGVIYDYDSAISMNAGDKVFEASGTQYYDGTIPIYLNFAIYDSANGSILKQNQVAFQADELNVTDIATNTLDESYVTGILYDFFNTGIDDGLIAKFDSRGKLVWSIRIPGTAALAVEVDFQGNIVVGTDADVRKLRPTGNLIWQRGYSVSGGYPQILARAIKLDSRGNIYAFGFVEYPSDFGLFVVQINSAGNQRWSLPLGGGSQYTELYNSSFTLAGDVFVAGPTNGSLLIARINPQGAIVWQTIASSWNSAPGIAYFKDPHQRQEFVYVAAQDGVNITGIQLNAQFGWVNWASSLPGYIQGSYSYEPNGGAGVDKCGNFLVPAMDSGYLPALFTFDVGGGGTISSVSRLLNYPNGFLVDALGNAYLGAAYWNGTGPKMAAAKFETVCP